MRSVSFVIPCYCSQNTIEAVVEEIEEAMVKMPQYQYEVVLINDSSPDGTYQTIDALARKKPYVVGVDLAKNFGQHAAIMAGLLQANGEIIVCLDDDGQTPANEVGKLLDKIEEGYDVVYASYTESQQNAFRTWGSKVNSKMTEIMLGKPKELSITSYFAARRFVVEEMLRYQNCYPYVIGLVLRSTKNICNVPVQHRQRQEGSSGYTLRKLLSLWLNGFTSFSVKPLRAATYAGVICAFLGFLYLIYIVAQYFFVHTAPLGWSSTVAILLFLGGMILMVLGLMGEYIGRIYLCINATPQYVIRRRIGTGIEASSDHEKRM